MWIFGKIGEILHSYSIDTDERKKIPIYLAIVSVVLIGIFSYMMSIINISLPWFLEPLYLSAPSAITLSFFLSFHYDKYLWRLPIFQLLGISKTPNFNGNWFGIINTSYDGHNESHDVKINITQQWQTISIVLETQYSASHSFIAGILINEHRGITLHYGYKNEPFSNAVQTMHAHRGTTWLIFNEETDSLEGEYYSEEIGRAHV